MLQAFHNVKKTNYVLNDFIMNEDLLTKNSANDDNLMAGAISTLMKCL